MTERATISVVPCDLRGKEVHGEVDKWYDNKFHILIDGVELKGTPHLPWCGTLANANTKADSLRAEANSKADSLATESKAGQGDAKQPQTDIRPYYYCEKLVCLWIGREKPHERRCPECGNAVWKEGSNTEVNKLKTLFRQQDRHKAEAAVARRKGNSPLSGRPLDDNGAIEFSSRLASTPAQAQVEWKEQWDNQLPKRLTINLDENCIETIKRLSSEGGEEISFGGLMGGVMLKWTGPPAALAQPQAVVATPCVHNHKGAAWDHEKQAYENIRCEDCKQPITIEEFLMICTRCGVGILKPEKYYRTKLGPHHETCPQVSVAFNHETGKKEVKRCEHDAAQAVAPEPPQCDYWMRDGSIRCTLRGKNEFNTEFGQNYCDLHLGFLKRDGVPAAVAPPEGRQLKNRLTEYANALIEGYKREDEAEQMARQIGREILREIAKD